jgi:hypothetical protein
MTIQGAGAAQRATFELARGASLPVDDSRQAFIGKSPSQLAPAGSGAETVLGALHAALRSGKDVSLLDLPPDVAQMILKSQAETAAIILNNWADSIREQAELDKEADKRRQLTVEQRQATERQRELYGLVARSLGYVPADTGGARPPETKVSTAAVDLVKSRVPATTVTALDLPPGRQA